MPNTINYADIFNRVIDEKFAVTSRTALLESNTMGIVWEGGKNVKIPKLTLQGLGTVAGGATIPDGIYTFEYESKSLQWDRGRNFAIPRYAVNETNFALNVGNIMSNFMKDHITPEVDKLRISTIAKSAFDAGYVTYEGASSSTTPLADLLSDISFVQDKIGDDKQLFVFMSQAKKTALMKSSEITKYLSVRDYQLGSVNLKMDALNDQLLIGVPSGYMYTIFTLNDGSTSGQEDGGVVADTTNGKAVNWLIVAKDSCLALGYPRVEKVITPDENQASDAWKIVFRMYHGTFILDNKKSGLWVNVKGAAPVTTSVKR